jgi:hypothetical protein
MNSFHMYTDLFSLSLLSSHTVFSALSLIYFAVALSLSHQVYKKLVSSGATTLALADNNKKHKSTEQCSVRTGPHT